MTADQFRILEDEKDNLADSLDGMSFDIVLELICLHFDLDENDFLETPLYRELLEATQSNPQSADQVMRRIVQINIELGE